MSNPLHDPLHTEAQALYNQLSLLSDVSAASLGQHVHQGKPGAKILSLSGEPPHLEFARRYNGCHTDRSRQAVVDEWTEALKAIRYSKRPSLDLQTLDGRLTVGRDTRPAPTVKHAYSISLATVYRWRKEAEKYDQRAAGLRRRAA
jgi:hypothetical protein